MRYDAPAQERKHPTLRDAIAAHRASSAAWKRDLVRVIVKHPNRYPASYATVLGCLLDVYGKRRICHLYLNTLADEAQVSRATTKRALQAVADLGLVDWKRTGRYLDFSFPMESIAAEIEACNERTRLARIERQNKRRKARDIARAEVAATPRVLPDGCDDNEPFDGSAVSHRDASPVSHRNPEQNGNPAVETCSCDEAPVSEVSEDELSEVNKRLGDEVDPVGIPLSPTDTVTPGQMEDVETGRRLDVGDDDHLDTNQDPIRAADAPAAGRAQITRYEHPGIQRDHFGDGDVFGPSTEDDDDGCDFCGDIPFWQRSYPARVETGAAR